MKAFNILALFALLSIVPVFAGNLSKADLKWKAVVAKKIASGPTTISTPLETRAKLAQQLAKEAGRKFEIVKTERGYRVKVQ